MLAEGGQVGVPLELLEVVVAGGEGGFQGGQGQRYEPVSLGLLLGVELVTDRLKKTPDPEGAAYCMARMKELGVLVSTDGPHRNVLKMKPPICFNRFDAETLARVMDQALSELPALDSVAVSHTAAHASVGAASTSATPDAASAHSAVEAMLSRHGPSTGNQAPTSQEHPAVASMLSRHR